MRQLKKLLGTSTLGNTDLLIPEILHGALIEATAQKLVLRNLPGFVEDRTLVGGHSNAKTYQIAAANSVDPTDDIPAGALIPESEAKIASEITITVRKVGVRPMVTDEQVEDGQFDMLARSISEATYQMARKIDQACGRGMVAQSGAFCPTSGPNCNHMLERSPAVVGSGLTIPDDILSMQLALETNDLTATDIIMHPNFYAGIRAVEWFTPIIHPNGQSGGETGVASPNGLVGIAYNMRWWQSTNLAYSGVTLAGSGIVLMWDANKNPWTFVSKRDLRMENLRDGYRDLRGASFTTRFNVVNLVPSACVWMTGISVSKSYYREFKDRAL